LPDADVVMANQFSPGFALFVSMNEATVTLQNCELHSVIQEEDTTPIVVGFFGEKAGLKLQNTTYTKSRLTYHVKAFNDTTEVYADGRELLFRVFDDAPRPDGTTGAFEPVKSISEASASTLQFIDLADGEELFKVCFES
jgi:hypothetical protein